jgi:TRAP transporter TAXI family solute receptor
MSPLNRKIFFGRSINDIVLALGPTFFIVLALIVVLVVYVDPAPPKHLVISTGDTEGDYQSYARQYQDIMKEDGIDLEIRASSGAMENMNRLKDSRSDVDVGFVQDGIGSLDEAPDVSSLGSLYYEPVWIFYRQGPAEFTRLTHLAGHRIAVGREGGGTRALSMRLLRSAGLSEKDAQFINIGSNDAVAALRKGAVDAAFFITTPEDPLVREMIHDKSLRLMSLDQAEAIVRNNRYLHHLVLPHGAMDLAAGIPAHDVDMVAPTATLLVKDSLHPALIYLLLEAAEQVHSSPGLLEAKDEFPIDKDYEFPLSDEAKHFYKSGSPFWQKHLPFWLATLVDRFLIFMIPAIAILWPMIRSVPKILAWRVKNRIFSRYGELKYLETQIRKGPHENSDHYLDELDRIEERVNHMKVPLDFSDHIYVLREHIELVRRRLEKSLTGRA